MRGSVLLGGVAIAALALAPIPAEAALFQTAQPAKSATLSFKSAPGIFTGQWSYQSIAISGNPKTSLARMSLGGSEFALTEQGGKITGTRPAGKGKTYPVEGFAIYGSRRAPQIVLHSVSVVNGKSYEYDYFGYLMPAWSVTANYTYLDSKLIQSVSDRMEPKGAGSEPALLDIVRSAAKIPLHSDRRDCLAHRPSPAAAGKPRRRPAPLSISTC